jgi:hypothetical protein
MSTRGVFVFADKATATVRDTDVHCVYVHHDTYPEGGAAYLAACFKGGWVWPLPRYEASEFAAGFAASIKAGRVAEWRARHPGPLPPYVAGGGVYLFKRWDEAGDIEWVYLLRPAADGNGLHLTLAPAEWASDKLAEWLTPGRPEYSGPLADFLALHGCAIEGADAPEVAA